MKKKLWEISFKNIVYQLNTCIQNPQRAHKKVHKTQNFIKTSVTGTFSPVKTFPRGKKVSRLFFPPSEKLPDFRHFFPRGKESERGKKVPVRVST